MHIDLIAVAEAAAASWAALRLCPAAADWLSLTGRARLVRAAATLPPGTVLTGRDWEIRVPSRQVSQ